MLATAVAGCLLAVAGYAHWQIPNCISGEARVWGTRLVLLLVGSTVGLCMAQVDSAAEGADTLFFLGFGMLHFPAALILFAKSQERLGGTHSNALNSLPGEPLLDPTSRDPL